MARQNTKSNEEMNQPQESPCLLSSKVIVRTKNGVYISEINQCENEKSFFEAVIQCIETYLRRKHKDTFLSEILPDGETVMHFQDNIAIHSSFMVEAEISVDPGSDSISLTYFFPLATRKQAVVQTTLHRLNQTLRFPKFIFPKNRDDCILATDSFTITNCFSEANFREHLQRMRWSLFWELHTFQELAREEQEETI